MPFDLLLTQPMVGFAWVLAIVVAIGSHEFAHAAIATALGDGTARAHGRLTVNPLAHVDPLGFLALLLLGFGWGKPVPFDPTAFRNRRWGPTMVALAGPCTNAAGFVIAGLLLSGIERFTLLPENNLLVLFLAFSFQIHVLLCLFNLIPIPPLDGSKFLLSGLAHPRYAGVRLFLETYGPMLLLGVVVLDSALGGWILGRPFRVAFDWVAGLF